jgi:hypothetical protein
MSFFNLCVAVLMFFNCVAILNEDRFLAKRACSVREPLPRPTRDRRLRTPAARADGWHFHDFAGGAPGAAKSLKGQALGIINAVSYMRSACAKEPAPTLRVLACGLPVATQLHNSRSSPCCCAVPLTIINSVVIVVKLVFG